MKRILVMLSVWAVAATMAVPFLFMVSTSLKTDAEVLAGAWPSWQWHNYAEAWRQADLGAFYVNSTIVAVAVTGLSLFHNALAGFAFARLRFRGKEAAFAVILATMMLPAQVSFVFAYLICGALGYVDTLFGLIVPATASAFGIFYMRQAVQGVPPSLFDAGRVDGLSDWELFWYAVLPCVGPAISALAIFTFMGTWNAFFWPLVMIDSREGFTLPLAVQALASGEYVRSWPVQMAALTIITLPNVAVFVVLQRRFVEGLALTGVKG